MVIVETSVQDKQKELNSISQEHSKHALLAGQKAWLMARFAQEIPEHQAKMNETEAAAAKLKEDIAAFQAESSQKQEGSK